MDNFETAKQLFFEGLRLLGTKNFQGAEIQFARSLEIMPDRVSTLNNLSAVKIRLNKFSEAEELALKAVALEDKSPEAWLNLGTVLNLTNRHEEALQAYDRAINGNSTYAGAWHARATTLLELERYDEALLACDQALKLDPSHHKVLYTKSVILKQLERSAEAQMIYRRSLEMRVVSSPAFIAERRATQKTEVLVINENPVMDGSLKSFEDLHRSNFPGQLAKRFSEDLHFTYIFEGDAAGALARKQISQPDFVINNNANGERVLGERNLSGLIALVDGFGVPVINHPSKIVQTTRDALAKLLDDLPGVVVPKTLRFSSVGKKSDELVYEIEDQCGYPLITRTLASQEGKGMTKVDSRDALIKVLSSGLPGKFYVTEFVDRRRGNEFFRKIRAAIVKDDILIVRVDYHTHWNVHGRKAAERVPFYLEHAHVLDEEKRIIKDPEAGLGRSAMQSLREIRDRIPLDVFGMDFDVDADGQMVFYEANATMNLFSTAHKDVPNPKEADECLKLAFQRYFASLVARR